MMRNPSAMIVSAAIFIFSPFVLSTPAGADMDQIAKLTSMVEQLTRSVSELQTTVKIQNEKINQLEVRLPQTKEVSGVGGEWLKDLKAGGDLRLRYEAFHNSSGHPSESDDRNRFRYRLRYGLEKKFTEEVKAGFSLASGEIATGSAATSGQNVDPTSTNTTFDNLFNFKPIFIEKAFATYVPNWAKAGPVSAFEITGGKFTNPFEKGSSDIIWDRDVKPEGAYEKIDLKLFDGRDVDVNAYVTAGQFVLDEDGTLGGDAEMFAHQGGLNFMVHMPFLEKPVDFHTAGSWYTYHDYEDFSNFIIGSGGTSLARGNVNADGNTGQLDAKDFEVIEWYNEVAIYPYSLPIRGFFDIAGNPADRSTRTAGGVRGENMAYAFGLRVGGVVKKGDWEASYTYKRVEPNSVVGAFNDSDFGVNGHSGVRGSVLKLGYGLTDNIQLNAAAYFVNNLATGAGLAAPRGLDEEQRRFQIDTTWKFG